MVEREITVNALARVEGEGALNVRIHGDKVEIVEFRIFEPPRFFEGILQGRDATEAPDITSRICGICPVAYITSASQAVEQAWGVEITPEIAALRRLIYCGEWIQSHVLHAALLHAPDFLGLHDVIAISEVEPELVTTALRLKKLGNDLMEVIGGRAVHPVNMHVGGFYKAPTRTEIATLVPELEWGVTAARELALRFARFEFPVDAGDYTFVAMVHPESYPIETGRVASSNGLDIPVDAFHEYFMEEQVARSMALHGRLQDGSAYLVGPLARYALNSERLTASARQTAQDCGLAEVERNPFKSILVRMVETQYACEEALRLARVYEPPEPASVPFSPRAGVGQGCSEAPRGICHHRYEIDAEGRIVTANIVPPTSQNQPQIEADLERVIRASLALDDAALKWRCEQVIRNFDPCISCATHFLKLKVERD